MDDRALHIIARHLPYVATQQMMVNLINQFSNQDENFLVYLPENDSTPVDDTSCRPSLARFHGTLLFVDISGFTALAQRLPVDELRVYINAYFKKILDLVYVYGGDVVKFAGDALYCLWKTEQRENESWRNATCRALRSAVSCGLAITSECSDYRVDLINEKKTRDSSHVSTLLLRQTNNPDQLIAEPDTVQQGNFTYLNVHAGLAAGFMAGIDVGGLDRWEYLLVGRPLADVAVAESEATKGELVMCVEAHDLVCGQALDGEACIVPCTCSQTAGGLYRKTPNQRHLAQHQTSPSGKESNNKAESPMKCVDEDDLDYEISTLLSKWAMDLFHESKHFLMNKFASIKKAHELATDIESRSTENDTLISPRRGTTKIPEGIILPDDSHELLLSYYLHWMGYCLHDDLTKHVHEAQRMNLSLFRANRKDCVVNCVRSFKTKGRKSVLSNAHAESPSNHSSPFVNKLRTTATSGHDKKHEEHEQALRHEFSLTGELRNVLVMFISLKSEPRVLFEDRNKEIVSGPFSFLKPSVLEAEEDIKLLSFYQQCMECMVREIRNNGGQLRQFIVDDKGTVCIGTFGLRGSVNHDNAAAAVEAALAIIGKMRLLDVEVGIGITSGKAYCGLVGCLRRHEYAVMGPSTNLSARLMSKARAGHIICDGHARANDRTHHYRHLGEVVAKGYAQPVLTYRPAFARSSMGSQLGSQKATLRQLSIDSMDATHTRSSPSASVRISSFDTTDREQTINSHYSSPSRSVPKPVNRARMIGRREDELWSLLFFFASLGKEPNVHDEESKDMKEFREFNEFKELKELVGVQSQGQDDFQIVTTTLHKGLDCSQPCRMIIFEGPNGIGKSLLLQSISSRIESLARRVHLNLFITQGRNSPSCSSDPFRSWRSVVRRILLQYTTAISLTYQDQQAETELQRSRHYTSKENLRKLHAAVEQLTTFLGHHRDVLPLLSTLHIVPGLPENEYTAAMNGQEKLSKLSDLILELIRLFPVLTGQVLLLIFDDAHFMDTYSCKLLVEVWSRCSGTLILTSASIRHNNDEQAYGCSCEALDKLETNERLARRALSLFAIEAVHELITNIFLHHDLRMDDEAVAKRMLDVSGGNPLYIYELSKAIVKKHKAIYHQEHRPGSPVPVTLQLLQDFSTARIEEVILFRFDQLAPRSQGLLKMAAVACSGGSQVFNLRLLLHMLGGPQGAMKMHQFEATIEENEGENEEDEEAKTSRTLHRLASELRTILRTHEFLRSSHRSSLLSEVNAATMNEIEPRATIIETDLTDEELWKSHFEFNISLERSTIYEIMLDEQRESLHDRVASFLEKENNEAHLIGHSTSNDLYDEGFHWQKAAMWGKAMRCFFHSAMLLGAAGAYEQSFERLTEAYRMLTALKKEAGVGERLQRGSRDLRYVVSMVKHQLSVICGEICELPEFTHHTQHQIEMKSYEDLRRVFCNDSELLNIGINVTLRLAQASFTLTSNIALISSLYEDALVMIMLTWSNPGNVVEGFGLKDPGAVFPILNGLAAMYRNRRLIDDEQHGMERTFYELILLLSRSSSQFKVHELQGECLLQSLLIEVNDMETAKRMTMEVNDLYDLDSYSHELVKIYGNDRVPFTLARGVQYLKLSGCVRVADEVLQRLFDLQPRLTHHLHSSAILALPLLAILVLLHRLPDARKVFQMYHNLEQTKGTYSFFRETNGLLEEFLFNGSPCFEYSPEYNDQHISESLSELQLQMLNKQFLSTTTRSLVHEALASMSFSVELCCASVLYTKAHNLLRLATDVDCDSLYDKALVMLRVAVEYLDAGLSFTANSSRLLVAHCPLLLQRACVCHEIGKLLDAEANEESIEPHHWHKEAKASLLQCIGVGLSKSLPLIVLHAAHLMIQLKLDHDQRAKHLQLHAIRNFITANGPENEQETLQEVYRMFPNLNELEHELQTETPISPTS